MRGWWDYPFIDPFAGGETVFKTKKNIQALVYRLLPEIAERLNAYHGTSYSMDFWRLLVFPWLVELVERAWTSYATLQIIKDRLGEKRLSVRALQDPPEGGFENSGHFHNSLLRDCNFNWWIDSEVAAAIAPENWILIPSKPIFPVFKAVERQTFRKPFSRIRLVLRNIKYRLGYSDIVGIRWSGLALAAYANLLPKKPAREFSVPPLEGHPESFFPENFLGLITRLTDITMPRSMLDGFEEMAALARKLPYRAGRLRFGALDHYNDQEKIIAAFAKEAREKLVHCQHGGTYGLYKHELITNEFDLKSNIFISWGWTLDEPGDSHILPLPGPYLSKLANRHRRRNDAAIVVGSPVRLRLGRIVDSPRGAGWIRYCEHTLDFLKTLSGDIREATIFRPYVKTASDIDIGQIVNDHFPEMPMLEGDFHAAMMNCRLLIIGNCSTTLNISMASNVPTVVYWHDDFLNLRDEAVPYFEAIKRCGIMFSDAEDAARHVNEIWDDVEGWWNSREVQDARKIWADQYARTDRFWWWQWMKALPKLKDVG
jgi:putative transferase (TIGR04331 family)